MLKSRLLTAALLLPVVLVIVFVLGLPTFSLMVGLAVLLAAWEWASLAGLKTFAAKVRYLFMLALLMIALWALILRGWLSPVWILILSALWWGLVVIALLTYPKKASQWKDNVAVFCVMGVLALVPCWLALVTVRAHTQGVGLVAFLMVLNWGTDSAAYFSGRRFGRTPLAPNISPAKTREGLWGGLGCSIILSIISGFALSVSGMQWLSLLVLGLLVAISAVVGDLFESMLKRQSGVKDSGKLLPGHGGFLDRIDSLLASAPIFALSLALLGGF